jgi:multidrug transporter EmrE-like cation transporter
MGALTTLVKKGTGKMNVAVGYILISVLGGAAGQVLLKKGMASMGPLTLRPSELGSILVRIASSPYVLIGLAIYVASTLFWLVALSRVDLSYAYPFASLSYLVMLGAAWFLFKEDLSVLRLVGTVVICAGVLLIARG